MKKTNFQKGFSIMAVFAAIAAFFTGAVHMAPVVNQNASSSVGIVQNIQTNSTLPTIYYPVGGEVLKAGQQVVLSWNTNGYPDVDADAFVNIYLSRVGETATSVIVKHSPNTGHYAWTVPTGVGTYVIRVSITDLNGNDSIDNKNADTSKPFKIVTDTSSTNSGENTPIISSISPTSAGIGDTVAVSGQNLRGFEGDKNLWIKNVSTGAEGIIYGDAGASDQVIKFNLASQYCSQDNSYSGKPCTAWLNIVPGAYVIYAEPWGKKSNSIDFVVSSSVAPTLGSDIGNQVGFYLLPNGKNIIKLGGTYNIHWNPANFNSSILTIGLLDESKNCSVGIVGCQSSYIIDTGIPNSGTYVWDTNKKMSGPSTGPNSVSVTTGTMYKIQIGDYDTDGYFTITN